MGIEPTGHNSMSPTDFEDRGGHQTRKRFRSALIVIIKRGTSNTLITQKLIQSMCQRFYFLIANGSHVKQQLIF